jgi:hypothetical protein
MSQGTIQRLPCHNFILLDNNPFKVVLLGLSYRATQVVAATVTWHQHSQLYRHQYITIVTHGAVHSWSRTHATGHPLQVRAIFSFFLLYCIDELYANRKSKNLVILQSDTIDRKQRYPISLILRSLIYNKLTSYNPCMRQWHMASALAILLYLSIVHMSVAVYLVSTRHPLVELLLFATLSSLFLCFLELSSSTERWSSEEYFDHNLIWSIRKTPLSFFLLFLSLELKLFIIVKRCCKH